MTTPVECPGSHTKRHQWLEGDSGVEYCTVCKVRLSAWLRQQPAEAKR